MAEVPEKEIQKYFKSISLAAISGLLSGGWHAYLDRNKELDRLPSSATQITSEAILFLAIIVFFMAVLAYVEHNLAPKYKLVKKYFNLFRTSCCVVCSIILLNLYRESAPIIRQTIDTENAQKLRLKFDKFEEFFTELERESIPNTLNRFILKPSDQNLVNDNTIAKMAIVPFLGNDIDASKVGWTSVKASKENNEKYFDFGEIKAPEKVTFLVIALKNPNSTNGFLYDIHYTWDFAEHWTPLREHLNNVNLQQTINIQSFIESHKEEFLK